MHKLSCCVLGSIIYIWPDSRATCVLRKWAGGREIWRWRRGEAARARGVRGPAYLAAGCSVAYSSIDPSCLASWGYGGAANPAATSSRGPPSARTYGTSPRYARWLTRRRPSPPRARPSATEMGCPSGLPSVDGQHSVPVWRWYRPGRAAWPPRPAVAGQRVFRPMCAARAGARVSATFYKILSQGEKFEQLYFFSALGSLSLPRAERESAASC